MKKSILLILILIGLNCRTSFAQNLIGYYPLNANTIDSTGLQTTPGVLHGCSWTSDSLGNQNSALSFNGTTDWVEFLQNPITQNQTFTICMWVKLNSLSDNTPFISLGYTGSSTPKEISFGSYEWNNFSVLYTGNYYQSSSNKKRVEQYPTFPLSSNLNLKTGIWYYVCIVYSDTNSYWQNTNVNTSLYPLDLTYKFYINGIKVNSTLNPSTWINSNASTTTAFPLNNKMSFGVSQGECPTKHFLNGILDEVKIYSGALSDQDILTNYQNAFVGLNEITTHQFSIYPNPSNGIFNLNSENLINYIVTNNLGQEILNKNSILNSQIDLTGENPGVYFVTVKFKNSQRIYKIILN